MFHDPNSAMWLRGGRMIDPARGYNGRGDVVIADGLIRVAGVPVEAEDAAHALRDAGRALRVIDLSADYIVAPGFVDPHVHLREPGFELRETIQSGALAAARGGYTTICCMPNTRPALDDRGVLEWVKSQAANASAKVWPIAAITKGSEGTQLTEMQELAKAGAVGFSDDGTPVRSGAIMRLALSYAHGLDRPIINHCEDPDLVGKGVMHQGAVSTRLGLCGWPAQGETVMLTRDLELAKMTGGRYHAAHLSVAGSVDLVRRAKDTGARVTAEVTPHHLLLSHAWVAGEREGLLGGGRGPRYDTATKVNPPLRTMADAEALLAGLRDGTIDCIATDHAPHSDVEKVCTYDEAAFGISGLETALGMLMALVHADRLDLPTLIAALTLRPAQAFNLASGTLAEGAAADVTVIAPDEIWRVDPAHFASQGRNTPLAGIELRGRVRLTICDGRVTFDAGEMS